MAKSNPDMLRYKLGKNGVLLWAFANGQDNSPVMKSDFVSPVKSIGHGITTIQDLENSAEVWPVMLELCQDIGHKLRVHEKCTGGIAISIRDNQLHTKEWQYKLPIPIQSASYIAKEAFSLFQRSYKWNLPIRSVTVRAINLYTQNCPQQINMFCDVEKLDKLEKLDLVIERIRERFGNDAIRNAVLCKDIKLSKNNAVELVMPTGLVGM